MSLMSAAAGGHYAMKLVNFAAILQLSQRFTEHFIGIRQSESILKR